MIVYILDPWLVTFIDMARDANNDVDVDDGGGDDGNDDSFESDLARTFTPLQDLQDLFHMW